MILYRLALKPYANALDGMGSKLNGGRWNSLGTPMIYCCDNIAQCMLEVLVHTDECPQDYCSVELIVPDDVGIEQTDPNKLPEEWGANSYNKPTQEVGDAFIVRRRTLLMRVPSAVVPDGSNYLMNPLHPDIERVKVGKVKPFKFDSRLFRKE
jgi:RES domain-containing protein